MSLLSCDVPSTKIKYNFQVQFLTQVQGTVFASVKNRTGPISLVGFVIPKSNLFSCLIHSELDFLKAIKVYFGAFEI